MAYPRINVIGSLNKDLVTRTSRIPSAGETLTATSFNTGSGGKGANQAVACARLSRNKVRSEPVYANVAMIGVVGDDSFGQDLQCELSQNCVDVSKVQVKKGEKTGVAVIVVEESSGENRILVVPNANSIMGPEYFDSLPAPIPDLIILQLEIPLNTVLRVLQLAKEKNVDVLLNPSPVTELPSEVYKGLTHLILNEEESKELLRRRGESSVLERGEIFLEMGVKNVVITMGSRGSYAFTSTEPPFGTPAMKGLNVIDTTAAGDTFVGAYGIMTVQHKADGESFNIRNAVSWATFAAGLAVEREGAQSSIPWLDDMPPMGTMP